MSVMDAVVKNLEYNYKCCKIVKNQVDKKAFMAQSFGTIKLAMDVDTANVKNYIKMWNRYWKPMFDKEVNGL